MALNPLSIETKLIEINTSPAWGLFQEKMSVIDEIAPVKSIRLKQHGCEWFNGEILDLISKRDKS